MLEKQYPSIELASMRDKLSAEGWEESELLPEGWIFKIRESIEELIIITSEGVTFRDIKSKVIDYVKESKNYNDGDVEGIEMFYDIEYSKRIASKYEWVSQDCSEPEGWKYRYTGSNNEIKLFLSPDGRTFQDRIGALKYMVASKYSEKDIDVMLRKFGEEGWNDDELLPRGWKFNIKNQSNNWEINML